MIDIQISLKPGARNRGQACYLRFSANDGAEFPRKHFRLRIAGARYARVSRALLGPRAPSPAPERAARALSATD